MSGYRVKGLRPNGSSATLELFAEDRAEAVKLAMRQGLTVESVWEGSGVEKKKINFNMELGGPKKGTPQEVAIFCRQLSISVTAGLPLRDALDGIMEELEPNTLRTSLKGVGEDLSSGKRFAESLEKHNIGKLFSPVFIGLIRVAEETGNLGSILNELADYLESGIKLKQEISSKLGYPKFMLIAFVLVNLAATYKLFPMFRKSFASMGSKLPELTLFVFDLNEQMIAASPYIITLLLAVFGGVTWYYMTPAGRLKMDGWILKIPAIGDLLFKINTARFCRTLSITAKGGIGLTEGIEISNSVVVNAHLREGLDAARGRIMNGQSFTNSLRESRAFSGLVLRMIGIGEESGQLPTVLEKISEIYNNEVDSAIAKTVSLIEPIIICLFAVFVTVMVLALYMPVFDMGG